jgi:hypothetical protein
VPHRDPRTALRSVRRVVARHRAKPRSHLVGAPPRR